MQKVMGLAFASALTVACGGDAKGTTGKEGRLTYTLYTRYEVPDSDLAGSKIITGYTHFIDVALTAKGQQDIAIPKDVVHSVSGAALNTLAFGEDVPDFNITATSEATLTIQSKVGDTLMDEVAFTFATPDSLDVVTWVREQGSDSWTKGTGDNMAVQEGAQVTFVPLPMKDNTRLAGDVTVEVSANPADAMLTGNNLLAVYENEIYSMSYPVSFFFVETGSVTVTFADAIYGVDVDQAFTVSN